MATEHVLINGEWRASKGAETFQAINPATKQNLPQVFPVSPWAEVEEAIKAAAVASAAVRHWADERFAAYLEAYAQKIEERSADIVQIAHLETGLPVEPRLKTAELPRTINQLRQSASAARDGSWRAATIDSKINLRACFGPLGPVVVFGPNNFPFAYNGIAGGDFASAVAAGNPVIGKAHSSHPGTTLLLGQLAHEAAQATNMPPGFVQLIYRTSHADGAKLVSHPLMGGIGYTGARATGLVLKDAADKVGKPIYLELSSINPVFFLKGAVAERQQALIDDFTASGLMGVGQFCTSPGLVIVPEGAGGEAIIKAVAEKYSSAPVGTLLSGGVESHLKSAVTTIRKAGAELVSAEKSADSGRFCHPNTLLKVSGDLFLAKPHEMQTEAFGNSSLFIVAKDIEQMVAIAESLEGNLTGSIYSHTQGQDDADYDKIATVLRQKVGRLLNDKMPTGVAVSAAMNHGGPFPATGHPGFTAVGVPAAIHRFAMLQSYDNVRQNRLPTCLQDKNPTGKQWRFIDGNWSQKDVG
jgi:alpha-ketoglutaric semialdehyde dehydrogenase